MASNECAEIIASLQSKANSDNVAGMARYGIKDGEMLGISIYVLRDMAKSIPKNHALALNCGTPASTKRAY
jgi:3-methyladenine DNA glycosylase AlkD